MVTVTKFESIKQARKMAARWDHVLTLFTVPTSAAIAVAHCTACDCTVQIEYHPDSFATISGTATTTHCCPTSKPAARPLTIDDLPRLTSYSELYHMTERYADGTPRRYRMASQVRRWKKTPDRFRFSLKTGFSARTIIIDNEDDLLQFTLDRPNTHRFP